MHYSNQSILDHPDTLDIWVSVVPICFSYLPFLLALHLSGSHVHTAASLPSWHGFLTMHRLSTCVCMCLVATLTLTQTANEIKHGYV